MGWRFADLHTLRNIESGYEIHLQDGTWFHPKKMGHKAPSDMNPSERMDMLRSALAHIQSLSGNANSDNTNISDQSTGVA